MFLSKILKVIKKITGKLYLSENLRDVVSSISLLTGQEYIIENDVIKVIR